ncbi:hypothetical protein, partial [uncultured Methylobacterium sp.]|uniref:hypothetical protein n=1 Tax=uncultured Methylobacterium sp. TaxID=157278 RepID=UPI002624B4C1
MRDRIPPGERRGLSLGLLAHTFMSLRAILARRLGEPQPTPAKAQRDYVLSRRATPSWMSDGRPTPPADPLPEMP